MKLIIVKENKVSLGDIQRELIIGEDAENLADGQVKLECDCIRIFMPDNTNLTELLTALEQIKAEINNQFEISSKNN